MDTTSAVTPIPLTTTFTRLPSCLSDYYWNVSNVPFISLGPTSTPDCIPSGWAITSQYFSPGLCPSGYKIACSSLTSLGNNTETRATCCPSSYSCQTEKRASWYSTEACTISQTDLGTSVLTVTQSLSGTTTIFTTLMTTGGVNAYGISIRFKDRDFVSTSGTGLLSGLLTLGTATFPIESSMPLLTSLTTLPSPSSSSTSSATAGAASDLPTRAKAGIGVGVSLFVLGLVSFPVVFIRWYRRGSKPQTNVPQQVEEYRPAGGRQELENSSRFPNVNLRHEIGNQEAVHQARGSSFLELHE